MVDPASLSRAQKVIAALEKVDATAALSFTNQLKSNPNAAVSIYEEACAAYNKLTGFDSASQLTRLAARHAPFYDPCATKFISDVDRTPLDQLYAERGARVSDLQEILEG